MRPFGAPALPKLCLFVEVEGEALRAQHVSDRRCRKTERQLPRSGLDTLAHGGALNKAVSRACINVREPAAWCTAHATHHGGYPGGIVFTSRHTHMGSSRCDVCAGLCGACAVEHVSE